MLCPGDSVMNRTDLALALALRELSIRKEVRQ